jgi:hypothetical protein
MQKRQTISFLLICVNLVSPSLHKQVLFGMLGLHPADGCKVIVMHNVLELPFLGLLSHASTGSSNLVMQNNC